LGSGYQRKNLETALRALALVPGLGLLVLGRESRPRRWQALARSLGVADRVCFRGAVRAPEHHFSGARAFLLPTRYDPSANATLEAMACGVPPVFSGRDGASELAPEPWMVVEDPHDHEAVAMTLQRVLERPELAGRVRAVAEDWPESRCFSALEDELRALAGGGPGEGA
jgi:UDP-glucose:(heptosyl)LPS alpha-1,3-glucosyltransferase